MTAHAHSPADPPAEFLDVRTAARLLNVGRRFLYRAIRDGKLRAAPINDRGDLRLKREWLAAYLERLADQPREAHQ